MFQDTTLRWRGYRLAVVVLASIDEALRVFMGRLWLIVEMANEDRLPSVEHHRWRCGLSHHACVAGLLLSKEDEVRGLLFKTGQFLVSSGTIVEVGFDLGPFAFLLLAEGSQVFDLPVVVHEVLPFGLELFDVLWDGLGVARVNEGARCWRVEGQRRQGRVWGLAVRYNDRYHLF